MLRMLSYLPLESYTIDYVGGPKFNVVGNFDYPRNLERRQQILITFSLFIFTVDHMTGLNLFFGKDRF